MKERWINKNILFTGKSFPDGYYKFSLFIGNYMHSYKVMCDNFKEATAYAREEYCKQINASAKR